jgi:hypothetical protein
MRSVCGGEGGSKEVECLCQVQNVLPAHKRATTRKEGGLGKANEEEKERSESESTMARLLPPTPSFIPILMQMVSTASSVATSCCTPFFVHCSTVILTRAQKREIVLLIIWCTKKRGGTWAETVLPGAWCP